MASDLDTTKIKVPKLDTTNPFNKGVTYEMFLKNVNDKTTLDMLLKKIDVPTSLKEWVKEELEIYKNNKK
jgi:hypothetical protein